LTTDSDKKKILSTAFSVLQKNTHFVDILNFYEEKYNELTDRLVNVEDPVIRGRLQEIRDLLNLVGRADANLRRISTKARDEELKRIKQKELGYQYTDTDT